MHPASLDVCGVHNPALLELIRTDVSREMVCKLGYTLTWALLIYRLPCPAHHISHCQLHLYPRHSYSRSQRRLSRTRRTGSPITRNVYRRRV